MSLVYEIIMVCLLTSLLLTVSDRLDSEAKNIHQVTLSQLNCMPTLIAIVLIMIRNVMLIMQMLIMKSYFLCGYCSLLWALPVDST